MSTAEMREKIREQVKQILAKEGEIRNVTAGGVWPIIEGLTVSIDCLCDIVEELETGERPEVLAHEKPRVSK